MTSSSMHVTLSRDEVLARILDENESVGGIEWRGVGLGKTRLLAPKNEGKFGAKTETLRHPKFCSVSYFNFMLHTIAFLCFFMPKMFFFYMENMSQT